MTLCAKCNSPIPDVEERFKTKLSPKDRRMLELIAAMECERLSPGNPLEMAFNIGAMKLMMHFTRVFIDTFSHALAEMPEGLERATKLANEMWFLQYALNETLHKLGMDNEIKHHKFLADYSAEANRE